MLKVDESSFCPKIVQNHNFARKGPSKMSENVVDCGAKEEDHDIDSHATIIWAGWVDMQGLVVTPLVGLKIQI